MCRRIRPSEIRQAKRFGHELIDPAVVQRYREQDQRPSSAAVDDYGATLDALAADMREHIDTAFDRALGQGRR